MAEKLLPIIDLSLANGSSRPLLVQQLKKALTEVGFIYLKGVEGYDEEELLRLTKWFFSLPLDARMNISKKSFNPQCRHEYRGFFPVIPGEVSHKEGFEMGPRVDSRPAPSRPSVAYDIFNEDNQWPQTDPRGDHLMPAHFQSWMEAYHQRMTDASLELMRLIAEGFGVDREFFTSMFEENHLSTLRLIRYPARLDPPEEARDGDYIIQTAEHRDTVMVTLLATFRQYPGLQVRWTDDSILDVPHRPGHLVVNIGSLLATISGGTLKATRHRVVDCCGERFSVPFFLEPRYEANINVVLPGGTPELSKDSGEKVEYGPWLFHITTKFAEYRPLLERVAKEKGLAPY